MGKKGKIGNPCLRHAGAGFERAALEVMGGE